MTRHALQLLNFSWLVWSKLCKSSTLYSITQKQTWFNCYQQFEAVGWIELMQTKLDGLLTHSENNRLTTDSWNRRPESWRKQNPCFFACMSKRLLIGNRPSKTWTNWDTSGVSAHRAGNTVNKITACIPTTKIWNLVWIKRVKKTNHGFNKYSKRISWLLTGVYSLHKLH